MGTAEVVAEQKKASYTPYVLVSIDSGTYEYDTTDRIKYSKEILEPYRHTLDIVLHNADKALNDISFKGLLIEPSWGFLISGAADDIAQAPMKVVDQEFDSRPGVLTCTLKCRGYIDLWGEEKADDEYTAEADVSPSTLIDYMLNEGVLYTNCASYTTSWTGVTKATAIDFYYPGDKFQIYVNSTRLNMIRKLLDNSYCFPRVTSAGVIEFIKPVTTGTTYAYEYELGGAHTFFTKLKKSKQAFPNGVTVYGGEYNSETGEYAYSGSSGLASYRAYYYIPNLSTDGQCSTVAAAIMSVFTQETETCVANVPMNCTAKLYDYVKITDSRNGNTAIGNIGHITRIFEKGRYTMQIKYGGWRSDRKVSELLGGMTKDIPATIKTYVSVSCPETYLESGDYIDFHVFGINASLYLKAYSVYKSIPTGSATVKLQIRKATGDTLLWEEEASVWQKLYNPLVAFSGTDTIKFRLTNEGDDPAYVNGMIVYAVA